MIPRYDERLTTQLAGALLRLRDEPYKMHYIKLMKLMYLVDREAVLRWGVTLTNDKYVSMDNGPVLSRTLDIMTQETLGHSYWKQFVSQPIGDYEVKLLREPETDELSKATRGLIHEVYEQFGYWNRWKLIGYTHKLPEWTDPKGSSLPIDLCEVLSGAGKKPQEIAEVINTLEEDALFEQLVG